MNERVDRLRESLEEPLLVTAPANVRYLSGFVSSNAALLVEPDRVRLFTDFRYVEAARAVEGVEVEPIKRNLYANLAQVLSGTIGFEASAVTYASSLRRPKYAAQFSIGCPSGQHRGSGGDRQGV